MKGPMTTQSLRGLAGAGVMHWRGDRNGGSGDPVNEDLSFKAFNPAFVGLLGNATQLSAADMQAYTDFILTVRYPPNPIRQLDNSLVGPQSAGSTFFDNTNVDGGVLTCAFCHSRPLGTHRDMSFEGEPQEFKIAHLRNIYQKVGMFGVPPGAAAPATGNLGPQVRGFGFLHDGSVDTPFDFLHASVFLFGSNADTKRRNLEAFAFAFDTGLAPIVGQQVSAGQLTLSDSTVTDRINLMIARDEAGECDLVVKGNLAGQARGWLYNGAGQFRSDRASEPLVSESTLRGQAGTVGQERTYTCVPPGSGTRIALDRDGDGFFDRTELDAGSDPANPASIPSATTTTSTSTTTSTTATTVTTTTSTTTTATTATSTTATTATTSTSTTTNLSTTSTTATTATTTTTVTTTSSTTTTTIPGPPVVSIQTTSLTLRDDADTPARRQLKFRSTTRADAVPNRIVPPGFGSPGDPTIAGATLRVYNSAGTGELVTVALAAGGWQPIGTPASPKGFRFRSTDPSAAVTSVQVKKDRIKIRGGRAAWTYTLDEPAQGSVALRLSLGTGTTWCAEAGRPPYQARIDVTDRFLASPGTPPPAVCPAVP